MRYSVANCLLGAGLTSDLIGGRGYEKQEFSLRILGVTFLPNGTQLFGSPVNMWEAQSVSMDHHLLSRKPERSMLAVCLFTVGYGLYSNSCLLPVCCPQNGVC